MQNTTTPETTLETTPEKIAHLNRIARILDATTKAGAIGCIYALAIHIPAKLAGWY